MPIFKILTNISKSDIPKDFVKKIIPVLVRTVKKDAAVFTIVVSGDCHVSFGEDSTTPAAAASLQSIGHVGEEENKVIGKEVSEFVHKELGIHPDRFILGIYDLKGFNIVKGAKTLG